jgi:hypothetical protein
VSQRGGAAPAVAEARGGVAEVEAAGQELAGGVRSRSMSRICRPHSSPRRTPVTTTSHRYSPRAALRARASAITVATSAGEVAGMGWRTFRTSRCPRAGLMVRRMNPSLV